MAIVVVLAACTIRPSPSTGPPSGSPEHTRPIGSDALPSPSTERETMSPDRPDLGLASLPPQPHLAGRLAFDNENDVYVLDLPTGRIAQLTDAPAREINPVWSPDGERIAYRSNQDGGDDIFVMDADGSNKRNLSRTEDRDEWGPTWSPDGRWLAFNASRPGRQGPLQIFVVRPDGADGYSLDTRYAEFPAWSPDGRIFAFASLREGATGLNPDYDIHTVNVDGTADRNLTATTRVMETNPQWSPDGSRIAFMASPVGAGTTSIWTMRPDGSDVEVLTHPWTAVPTWSPDGAHIAYLEVHADHAEIKVMKPDGTDVITFGLAAPRLGFVSWTR